MVSEEVSALSQHYDGDHYGDERHPQGTLIYNHRQGRAYSGGVFDIQSHHKKDGRCDGERIVKKIGKAYQAE